VLRDVEVLDDVARARATRVQKRVVDREREGRASRAAGFRVLPAARIVRVGGLLVVDAGTEAGRDLHARAVARGRGEGARGERGGAAHAEVHGGRARGGGADA